MMISFFWNKRGYGKTQIYEIVSLLFIIIHLNCYEAMFIDLLLPIYLSLTIDCNSTPIFVYLRMPPSHTTSFRNFPPSKVIRFLIVLVRYKFEFGILSQVHILQSIRSNSPIQTSHHQLPYPVILKIKKVKWLESIHNVQEFGIRTL